MSIFSTLRREQKEAVGLLSIGTFLEYFDLMLYVHMAVLLNELFFPKTDPFTASLLSAFAFCSTYLLRPLGALVFGYIGDHVGRKPTVVITTLMMAIACITMANLPTYEEIGITAAWIVTLCRIIQGMSSMGEATGAELYLIESTKLPARYTVVALVMVCCGIGGAAALGVATFFTSTGLSWRIAFWIGAIVALIGTIARTTLREAPDFVDAKKRIQEVIKETGSIVIQNDAIWKEKVNKKTAIALFFIQCGWPVCFYFTYVHCGGVLKNLFNFTPEQVISNNFIVCLCSLTIDSTIVYLTSKIYPLRILKLRLLISPIVILLCPYLLNNATSSSQIMLIQLLVVCSLPTDFPGISIFYTYFPILKRFTSACFIYALARAVMHVITAFGLVYLLKYFGNWGIWFIMMPVILGYGFGLFHFEKLEKDAGYYPKKKTSFAGNFF